MQEIIAGLSDLSFRKFVTPKILKYIYILAIAGSALQSLLWLRLGTVGIIAAPIAFLVSIVFIRMFMEMALALFQIAKYAGEIARRGRSPSEEAAAGDLPVT